MTLTSLFAIGIVQGIFLLSLLSIKENKNRLASRIISAIIATTICANAGYFSVHTELSHFVPQVFALSFGIIFLYGPLLFLYARAVIDPSFNWKRNCWLHFIPYAVQLCFNLPFILAGRNLWIEFVRALLQGNLPMRNFEKFFFALQIFHLLFYALLTIQWVRKARYSFGNVQYIISLTARIKWVKQLAVLFVFFSAIALTSYLIIIVNGKYNPITHGLLTLVTSGIIYFMAYKLVLSPELISPAFVRKYSAYMEFGGDKGEKYLSKLKQLMSEKMIFTHSDLKLATLAEQLRLPPHQLSKLINEKFNKTFNDYIAEFRVSEFINRVSDIKYQSYSIYGIALDVGFNSKSSFNSTFKKITGKSPSEYRKNGKEKITNE